MVNLRERDVMPPPTPLQASHAPSASSDLAALLTTLRQHLALLVLGPIVTALVTFALIGWMPKQYVSSATIDLGKAITDATDPDQLAWKATMTKTAASLLASPEVQQAATKALGLPVAQLPAQAVKIKTLVPDGQVVLSVKGHSPEQAQQLAEALLEATYAASQPNDEERSHLEQEHRQLTTQLDFLNQTDRRLHQALGETITPQTLGTLATAVPLTQERIDLLEKKAKLIQWQQQSLTKRAVADGPTLPTSAADPHRGLWAGISALATLFALISALLMRQAWREMRQASAAPAAQCASATVADSA